MEGELFALRIFVNILKFSSFKTKNEHFCHIFRFQTRRKNERFQATNINSGLWNLATESDIDNISTKYL